MIGLALLGLAILFLSPFAGLFAQADLASFSEAWQALPKPLSITLLVSSAGSLFSLGVGVPFARYFAFREWNGKRVQRIFLLLPYLIPNFVLSIAYVLAWNPVTGLMNPILRFPFGLYGNWGMIFLLGVSHVPIAFLLAEEKFKRIDPALREAARLSGAGTYRLISRVEIPMVFPSFLSAFALSFGLNLSAFAIPAWIGAPEKAYTLTYKVYQTIQIGGIEGFPGAAAFSVFLFALTLIPWLIGAWGAREEKRFALVSGKGSKQGSKNPSRVENSIFQFSFWLTQGLFWIAPLGCLFLSTLVKPGCLQHRGLSCLSDSTLRSYIYVLFDLTETRLAFCGSFFYGALSAVLLSATSLVALILFSRSPLKAKIVEWIFFIPLATPGAILALGLIVTCSGRFWINWYNTPWIVVAAFVIKHISLVFQPMRTGLANLSHSLQEAARTSGARDSQVWGRIILPILKPEWMGGFFLVLIPILGELTMSVFLTSPSYRSIGTVLFDLQDYADQTSAAALAILLVISILILNELTRWVSRGRLGY